MYDPKTGWPVKDEPIPGVEVYPAGWTPPPPDFPNGCGRVIKVILEGRPEQVATITTVGQGYTRLYLPDSNEYVTVEWVGTTEETTGG